MSGWSGAVFVGLKSFDRLRTRGSFLVPMLLRGNAYYSVDIRRSLHVGRDDIYSPVGRISQASSAKHVEWGQMNLKPEFQVHLTPISA